MAIQIPDTLYIIKHRPSNRREKRIAQKEYEKIQKALLPIVFVYLQEENKTDALRVYAKEQYIKYLPKANNGNIFVIADPMFFDNHFPTEERIKQIITPRKDVYLMAYVLLIIISIFVILFIASLFFT